MATHTEYWEGHHCGGGGSVTFDTRPCDGVPPMYGDCMRCGYIFGCGEDEDFTHPDSYGYLKTLHDINSERYYGFIEEGAKYEDWVMGAYTKDKYFRIIYDAGLEGMILNPLNTRIPSMTADEFFSDEWCRLKNRDSKTWCGYCKSKGLLYQSPFINWKKNLFEVK